MVRLSLLCLFLTTTEIRSGEVLDLEFQDAKFTAYRFNPSAESLKIFWKDTSGKPFGTFQNLASSLKDKGLELRLAMNAGIYLEGSVPEGLHIEEGKTLRELNLSPAPDVSPVPNFSLKPNGVFFIREDDSAAILESQVYSEASEKPRLATQSGPMLVIEEKIHPVFSKGSESRKFRNGVGVDTKGRVILVCSKRGAEGDGRVNFYDFASLFRDELDCPNALYLDGVISRFYLQERNSEIPETIEFAAILALIDDK